MAIFRILSLGIFVLLSLNVNSQYVKYNPSNDGLRIYGLVNYSNQYLAITLHPYFLKIDQNSLNSSGFTDFQSNFKVENLASLGDTILYEWKRSSLSQSRVVSISKDGGETWSLHPFLRNYSGQLHIFDSLFVVDGEYNLIRYTLNGGRSYDSLSLSGSQLLGEDDQGVYIRKLGTDSLVYIESSGPNHIGVLDSSLGTLSHLQKSAGQYFVLQDWKDLIELDSNFNFTRQIHRFEQVAQGNYKSFNNGDTLVYVKEDSVVFTLNAGQSWQKRNIGAPLDRNRKCLALSGSKIVYSYGAGTLLIFNLNNSNITYNGVNRYPNLYGLCKAGYQFAGIEPVKLEGPNNSLGIFHRLDQNGNLVDSSLVPFASPKSDPPMAFKDSLNGVFAALGRTYYTGDGGNSWNFTLDVDSADYIRLRSSRDGSCYFGYGIAKNGFFIARIDDFGNRSPLNFSLNGNEKMQDIIFSTCDTGLIVTNVDFYKTTDGGQTFQSINQGYVPLWRFQFKEDSILLAAANKNYFSKGPIGPFTPIDNQPIFSSPSSSNPYFFFNAHRVISYDADESKFRIADTRYNFSQSLSLPVDYIYDFLPSDSGAVAIGAGGQFYGIREEALFPADLALIEGLSLQPEIKVYPNPSNGYLSIEGGDFKEYKLYSLKGYLLDSGYINEHIDISKFQSGIYILELNGSGESSSVRRLIYRE